MGRLRGEGLTGRTLRSSPGSHRRLFFEGDRLAGYILSGDVRQAGLLAGRIGEPLREGYLGRFRNLDEEYLFA